jgi:DNA-binding transcriptional ArsR family regulator
VLPRAPAHRLPPREADLAPVAAAIGDPARATMLAQLLDGRSLPAGELARRAGVSTATASSHLARLVGSGLVRVRPRGRHRYHELASPLVAEALEALALIAPSRPARSLRQGMAADAMREARSCYDHLAGRLGVALRDGLLASGALATVDDRDHVLTSAGRPRLRALGIDPDELAEQRRVFARTCLDWTERRPHLAGALPGAVYAAMLRRGWLVRRPGDRGLRVTPACIPGLRQWLGLPASWPDAAESAGD